MKLKYFFPTLVAALAMLTGCSNDYEASYLGEVSVSSSYVALSATGGSSTITLKASADWSVADVPAWLTVSPASGSAGETNVTFSAGAASATNQATIKVNCGGRTQEINVIQMTEKVDLPVSTCAQVIAGEDGKSFRVSGVCTAIANTTYGNWYLNDGTGEVYIYGTLDANGGTKNFLSWGLEVGDIVTVEGPKTTYGGTVELVDVTVVKIEKSLIKVDSLDTADPLPLEGGVVTAALTCKGNGVTVNIPEDAKSWLSVIGITTAGQSASVKFQAAPNAGGDRSTVVTFVTSDGSKQYTSEATISQKGAIVECSVADFLAAEVGDTQYRITGVISSVANASYGNIYLRDFSGEAYVYGIGSRGDFEALGLKAGDIVTLVGKRAAYRDTPQMGGAQYESHKSVTEVTIAEFLTKPDDADTYYMVTGVLDEIANSTYGNIYLKDGDDRVYSYGCYPGWGATGDARKNALETLGIELGDKVTVIGVKSTYRDVPQINGGIYFSHEKPTAE